jgi:Uma2 family endonuclease
MYLKQNPIGTAYAELHCRLQVGGETRYRLPDLCVMLGPPVDGHPERAPEFCVEIRSPDDSIADQVAKFEDYFANGCRLGWLVLPEENSVLILTPGSSTRAARMGDTLDGGDVLPGLAVPVETLFA